MLNLETAKKKYADLTIKKGLNLECGQPLVITSSIENADFVRILAKSAYEIGAKEVHVNWNDGELTKMKYKYSPMEVFENFPKWYADAMETYAKDGAAFLSIVSSDPELLKDADTKKIAANNKSSSTVMKNFRKYTMNNINTWCVIAAAGKDWAKSLFSDLEDEKAITELWTAIFKATRTDLDDPEFAWDSHIENLSHKVDFLNSKSFRKLVYKTGKGTDLEVSLPKGHIWSGGGDHNSKNRFFIANIPTEEVFTLPEKNGVNGVVFGTKPLFYSGNMIDEFSFVFKDGKIIDFDAATGKDVLYNLLEIDEGARYLGEVALVPYDSPISNTGLLFKNTLFDENASCHFAIGKAYPTSIKNGENMTDEELEARGVNDSLTHVDFMVGDKDMTITGIDEDGNTTIIFKNGNWAI
ncbi:aminopeptidase [Alkalibacter mobilis]|uniref:aminopeptidase n=1 Tax=Alkalibacter mobilis TaxID=2787712 RepID=UPI0018A106D3|nr:aminopeptidase [Alkalibacter mobilis]MBF7095732.1 aminopeptidase [Alkalibacter mobilis]